MFDVLFFSKCFFFFFFWCVSSQFEWLEASPGVILTRSLSEPVTHHSATSCDRPTARGVRARNISCGLSMWLSSSGKCCYGTALGALFCICWFLSWIKKPDKQDFWPPTQRSQTPSARFTPPVLTDIYVSPSCCWLQPKMLAKPLICSLHITRSSWSSLPFLCAPLVTSQGALVCHWFTRFTRCTRWVTSPTARRSLCPPRRCPAFVIFSKYVEHQLYVPASVFQEAVNRARYALRMLRHWTLQWQNRA